MAFSYTETMVCNGAALHLSCTVLMYIEGSELVTTLFANAPDGTRLSIDTGSEAKMISLKFSYYVFIDIRQPFKMAADLATLRESFRDEAMAWGHAPHYWSSLGVIPVVSPHRGSIMRSLDTLSIARMNMLLNKQWGCHNFRRPWDFNEMYSHSP